MKEIEINSYIENRKVNKRSQRMFWRARWRSGLLRLLERILTGGNVSDRLSGNGMQLAHLATVKSQFGKFELYSAPKILKDLEINIDQSRTIIFSSVKQPEYKIVIKGGIVSLNNGSVWLKDGFTLDSVLPHWQQLLYRGGISDSLRKINKIQKKLNGDWTFMPRSSYFYHQLTEDLPKVLKITEGNPAIKILAPTDAHSSIKDLLTLMPNEVHYYEDDIFEIENLHVLTSGRVFTSDDGNFLRKMAFSPVSDIKNIFSKKRLYIIRGELDRGDADLEGLLMRDLKKLGFLFIEPETLTIFEQIQIFASAEIIIGFHGGSLTNAIWMKEAGHMIEIFNHPFRTYDFVRLSSEMALNYHAIELSTLDTSTSDKAQIVLNICLKVISETGDAN